MWNKIVFTKLVMRNLAIEPPGAQIIFSNGMFSAISLADNTIPSIDKLRMVEVDELYTGISKLYEIND